MSQTTSFTSFSVPPPTLSASPSAQSKGGRPNTTLIALFVVIGILFLTGSVWAAIIFRSKLRPPPAHARGRTELRNKRPVLTAPMFDMLRVRPIAFFKRAFDDCAICLCAMNGQVVLLPCNHAFHKMCARGWLMEQSEECPLCKRSVRVALGILEAPEELAPVECEIGARRAESSV